MFFSEEEEEALIAQMNEDLFRLWQVGKRKRDFSGHPHWKLKNLIEDPSARVWWNLLRTKHKKRFDRYQLTRFFYFNNLPCHLIKKWVLLGGNYDSAALRDQEHLFLMTKGKTTQVFHGGRLLDLATGNVIEFPDQKQGESNL